MKKWPTIFGRSASDTFANQTQRGPVSPSVTTGNAVYTVNKLNRHYTTRFVSRPFRFLFIYFFIYYFLLVLCRFEFLATANSTYSIKRSSKVFFFFEVRKSFFRVFGLRRPGPRHIFIKYLVNFFRFNFRRNRFIIPLIIIVFPVAHAASSVIHKFTVRDKSCIIWAIYYTKKTNYPLILFSPLWCIPIVVSDRNGMIPLSNVRTPGPVEFWQHYVPILLSRPFISYENLICLLVRTSDTLTTKFAPLT